MSTLLVGHAYTLQLKYTNPPKKKYAICVCEQKPLFLLISSKARTRYCQSSQVKVTAADLNFLRYDSFINTGEAVTIVEPVSGRVLKDHGPIPEDLKEKVIGAIAESPTLPQRFINLFTTNLLK